MKVLNFILNYFVFYVFFEKNFEFLGLVGKGSYNKFRNKFS